MTETRAERRLAAILAGDVVGYSRLMGADEEGTLARLNALRREFWDPKIAEHRGRKSSPLGEASQAKEEAQSALGGAGGFMYTVRIGNGISMPSSRNRAKMRLRSRCCTWNWST